MGNPGRPKAEARIAEESHPGPVRFLRFLRRTCKMAFWIAACEFALGLTLGWFVDLYWGYLFLGTLVCILLIYLSYFLFLLFFFSRFTFIQVWLFFLAFSSFLGMAIRGEEGMRFLGCWGLGILFFMALRHTYRQDPLGARQTPYAICQVRTQRVLAKIQKRREGQMGRFPSNDWER